MKCVQWNLCKRATFEIDLVVDVERWLSYKGAWHDMYLYKTDTFFFHIKHYLKSVSKVALLHRFHCTDQSVTHNIQSNLNSSNPIARLPWLIQTHFWVPTKFLSITHEKKYLGIFSDHETVCCMYSLELPHWGNSNKYTQHTIIV